jgi:hypothetical protein
MALQGAAYNILDQATVTSDPSADLKQLKSLLRRRFGRTDLDAFKVFATTQLEDYDSVEAYYDAKKRALTQMSCPGLNFHDQLLKYALYAGLPHGNPSTLLVKPTAVGGSLAEFATLIRTHFADRPSAVVATTRVGFPSNKRNRE